MNRRLLFWMQGLGQEFASKWRDAVVEQLEEGDSFVRLQELADGTHSFVLAEGLPEADRDALAVLDLAKGVH